MEIREIDRHDETLVRRHWEIGRAADAASRPYDFYVPWETALTSTPRGREDFATSCSGRSTATRWWAPAPDLPLLDNQHLAFGRLRVHPDHQRRGVGTALVGARRARWPAPRAAGC